MPVPGDEMGDALMTCTPIPVPAHFSQAEQSFSHKKRGRPLCYSLPPRPPVKSIPPISRIFPNKQRSWSQPRPQSVSFRSPHRKQLVSRLYDHSKEETFFKQCFQTLCKLGRGSFGEVYKVRSREDGCVYAVKRSVSPFRGESDRLRKLQEVKKHERVGEHPNCLRFVRAWEEKRMLYLQTELCMCSLQQYSEELGGPSPPQEIWNITCDLLRGLKHLHDRNLLHLDIKPANVFISCSGVYKLGDFGLMVELDGAEGSGDAQEGDPRYMAPELLNGVFTKAADVFSLGMTLLEVACNMELPKSGEGWQQLRKGHLPTDFTSELPPDFLKVLSGMLEPHYRRRATVDWLLFLPAIQRAERWRRVTMTSRGISNTILTMFQDPTDQLLRYSAYHGKVYMPGAVLITHSIAELLVYRAAPKATSTLCIVSEQHSSCQFFLWLVTLLLVALKRPATRLLGWKSIATSVSPPSSPSQNCCVESSLSSDWADESLGDDVFEVTPSTLSYPRNITYHGQEFPFSSRHSPDLLSRPSQGSTSTPRNLSPDYNLRQRSTLPLTPNVSRISQDSPRTVKTVGQDTSSSSSGFVDAEAPRSSLIPRNLLTMFDEALEQ